MSISSHTPESSQAPEPHTRASRAEAIAQWRRRSRLIHFLRKALPAAIVALGLVLVGWVGVKSLLESLSDLAKAGAIIHMTNPHFVGQDDHGRGFVVTAREAQRTSHAQVRLIEPGLKLAGAGGRSIEASARGGTYEPDPARRVELLGDVRFATGDGTVFRTQQALIDMRSGTVTGNSPVEGVGPLGQIRASSYAIYDRGAQVVFEGQVHAHLVPRRR
jgi:lipopolysaccharide export system protein LptC